MNQTPPADENLDRLLSDFLKAQMPHPWPAAPSASATSEPSALLAARAGASETPRNQPAARRDTSAKARFTLAASVALLLGTCWTLSNGFRASDHPATGTTGTNPTDVLSPSNAKTPKDIKDALHPPVVPPGGKDDMFGKSK